MPLRGMRLSRTRTWPGGLGGSGTDRHHKGSRGRRGEHQGLRRESAGLRGRGPPRVVSGWLVDAAGWRSGRHQRFLPAPPGIRLVRRVPGGREWIVASLTGFSIKALDMDGAVDACRRCRAARDGTERAKDDPEIHQIQQVKINSLTISRAEYTSGQPAQRKETLITTTSPSRLAESEQTLTCSNR